MTTGLSGKNKNATRSKPASQPKRSRTQSGTQMRAWQRMLSGRRLDLVDPSPMDIEIEDIAHGLARVARWNGQTLGEHAFSVAQHSLLVLQILERVQNDLPADLALYALLHDGPEYVVGDMISPFKAVIGSQYKTIEKGILSAIHLRFGLSAEPPALYKKTIKQADQIAAYFEATHLAGFSAEEARQYFGRPHGISPDVLFLDPWPTQKAEQDFIERFFLLDRAMRD